MPDRAIPALVAALALGMSPAARSADIFPYPVYQSTLDNGLEVVVVPFDSPGIVAYHTIVRTGSRDEVEAGHSGFAHFFEHMMFRGTQRYSQDDYNDVLKRMGADSNAFTSDDRTQFYIVGPSRELETMMDIESDRFRNLEYDEDVFRREALAVLGEYNKNVSNPFLPMYERLRELAFDRHTYRHTTMGYLADIKAMPGYYDYSRSFFHRFYRPENCVLLIVGDVEPEATFELAARYYGPWQAGYQPATIPAETPQEEPAEAVIDWPAPIRPHLMIGYHAPAFSDSTVATAGLDLLGQLLFSESAELYQKLVVEEQWVDFVNGSYSDHRDPYLFTVYTRVKSEESVPKVLQAIDEYVARMQAEPVDAERLERTKSHMRYSFALGLDSAASVAFTLSGYLSLTGDPQSVNRVYAQYQAVTPEDIQHIAREVFQPERRTLVRLIHPATGGATAGGS